MKTELSKAINAVTGLNPYENLPSIIGKCGEAVYRLVEEARKADDRLKDFRLHQAEQQITGFVHRSEGYDLESLINSMGLTKDEWISIKDNFSLPDGIINEIDDHFKI